MTLSSNEHIEKQMRQLNRKINPPKSSWMKSFSIPPAKSPIDHVESSRISRCVDVKIRLAKVRGR